MEDVVKLLEFITQTLESGNHDKQLVTAIIRLNGALKTQGNNLELFHRDLLDKAQVYLDFIFNLFKKFVLHQLNVKTSKNETHQFLDNTWLAIILKIQKIHARNYKLMTGNLYLFNLHLNLQKTKFVPHM